MRTDDEIRQSARPDAAGRPVQLKSLARKEKRRAWNGHRGNRGSVRHLVESLDAAIANRQLGVDNVVDDEPTSESGGFQPCL